jgi:asparagine synthase (glutamine-hydrolysing)
MCRIAGILTKEKNNLSSLAETMRDCMQHGGPDDKGIYIDDDAGIALGNRRLSIIDLSPAGHMPMSDDDGNLQITFNGEIFNYRELKAELKNLGHHFITNTDTEVVIKAYRQWGNNAWSRLNGMYAFAIYDKKKNILILVRDHAGIKPLYYSHSGASFYFASEVKAFKTIHPAWKENPNWKIYFLAFGHLPEPVTTLNGVHALAKGSYMQVNVTDLTTYTSSFNRFEFSSLVKNEAEAIEKIRTTLDAAVKRHLISVDSSILTLLAKKYQGKDLYTLSINFDQSEFSEKRYQDIIIEQTKANHHSFLVTQKDFENQIPDIFKAMDQPSVDGINTYFISKYAKEYGLKAVLSGLGADELLGGYPSFKYGNRADLIQRVPAFALDFSKKFLNHRLRKIDYLGFKNGTGEYLFYRGNFIPGDIARILDSTEEEITRVLNKLPQPRFSQHMDSGNRISYLEQNYYMQNQLLKDSDYMSMWHSVELRVPFLDKEFMQLVHSIDPVLKFGNKQGKYLLIKAFEDMLPREIWDRKKQGFVFPFSKWFPQSNMFLHNQNAAHKNYYRLFETNQLSWGRIWTIFIADYYNN